MTSLVTKHYAGLFNGISQQAPTLRLDTQAQNQENGWSSLVYGLMTRPPTRFIKELEVVGDERSFYHSINRDKDEKYMIGVHRGANISVYDLKGVNYFVEGLQEHRDYLNVLNPKRDIVMTTIADYTFIVNKHKKVQMQKVLEVSSATTPAQCKVTISSSAKSGTYSIRVDGATIATVSGFVTEDEEDKRSLTKEKIISQLRDAINAYSGFSATYVVGDSFTFRKVSGAGFNPSVEGNLSISYTPSSTTTLLYDTVGYIYVSKGVAEQNYQVIIDKVVVASYSSGNTSRAETYKTDVIASSLYSQIIAKGFSAEIKGSVIKIWKKDGSDFSLETHDSWGEAALKGFKGRAQAFSQLPAKCFEGAILQIAGKTDSEEGSYWVKYETSYVRDGEAIQTSGVWKESREPNKEHKFKQDTMPLQLVRKQDISRYATKDNPLGIYFSLEYSLWAERGVGDENSAPPPSFVGRGINDIFLFSNRLGILSGQSICLTAVGDFFNFFPTTVTDALDDEPIDVDAPSLSVTNLYHAIPSRDNLMIFSNDQQFMLNSGNEPLTSKTINITSILQYPCDSSITPLLLGQMAYFVSPRGEYITLREYFIQSEGIISDAPSITDHIPTLLKYSKGVPHLSGIANEDMLFVTDGTQMAYVYKFNWTGDQKTQSSWSKWVFNRNIIATFEFDNALYIIFDDKSLEKIEFVKDSSCKFVDSYRKIEANEIIRAKGAINIYELDGSFIQRLESGWVSFDKEVIIGFVYTFRYEFSPIFLKFSNDNVGTIQSNTLLRSMLIYLEGETSFDLVVNDITHNKARFIYHYKTPKDKSSQYSRGFLLRGEAKQSSIEIVSTSDKQVVIQSASFELLTSLRSKPL